MGVGSMACVYAHMHKILQYMDLCIQEPVCLAESQFTYRLVYMETSAWVCICEVCAVVYMAHSVYIKQHGYSSGCVNFYCFILCPSSSGILFA